MRISFVFPILLLSAAFISAQPSMELYPSLKTAGVNIYLNDTSDPEGDVSATIKYRLSGTSDWMEGFPLTLVSEKSWLSGSLFWLEPGTNYDVATQLSDPTTPGLNSSFTGTFSTRLEFDFTAASNKLIVSPNGTGTACSEAQPCGFATALAQVTAGQDIELKGGVYYLGGLKLEKSGTANAPITIRGRLGEQAILDGSDPDPYTWQPTNVAGVFVANLKTANANTNCVIVDGVRLYPYSRLGNDLFKLELGCILGQPVPIGLSGMWRDPRENTVIPFAVPNPFYKKLYVHLDDDTNPTTHDLSVSLQKTCITIDSQSFIRFKDITFRYYGVAPARYAVLLNNCNDIVFDHCLFDHNDKNIVVRGRSDHFTAQYCTFLDDTDWGTYIGKATYEPATPFLCYGSLPDLYPYNDRLAELGGITLDHGFIGRGTIIRGNVFQGFMDGTKGVSPPGAPEVTYTQEIDIFENVLNGGDDGIEIDGVAGNVRFVKNQLRDCSAAISLAPAQYGPVYLIRNVISDFHETLFTYEGAPDLQRAVGTPLKFQSGFGVKTGEVFAFHNTICVKGTGSAYGLEVFKTGDMDLFTAKNNIFFAEKNFALALRNSGAEPLLLDLDYNNYNCSDTLVRIQLSTGIQYFPDLQGFTTATGLEQNGLRADPLFMDTSANDYHLMFGSPCVDRGVVIPGINDRGFNGAAPDLGAFEQTPMSATANPPSGIRFRLSPNPAKDQISIEMGAEDNWSVSVVSMQGNEVAKGDFFGRQLQLKLFGLAAGVYYVRVSGFAGQGLALLVIL